MNNYKSDLKQVLNSTFYWLILNTSFNLFGLWFSKLVLKENFVYNQHIVNEFITPILIQTLIFFLCGLIFVFWFKKFNKKWYTYPGLQVILMHIAFFAGLKFAGGLHFETSFSHLGLRYLSLNGQYFIEFLFVKMPFNGVFTFESFKPTSTIVFYLQWVLSICAYYTLISWLSTKVTGFFKLKTADINFEDTAN